MSNIREVTTEDQVDREAERIKTFIRNEGETVIIKWGTREGMDESIPIVGRRVLVVDNTFNFNTSKSHLCNRIGTIIKYHPTHPTVVVDGDDTEYGLLWSSLKFIDGELLIDWGKIDEAVGRALSAPLPLLAIHHLIDRIIQNGPPEAH